MRQQSFTPLIDHVGIGAYVQGANIDTDQIVPRKFLGVADKSELRGAFLHDWAFNSAGQRKPDFILNRAPYDAASVLLVDANFGCGSSREHAAWAISSAGIRVLLGLSFGEMFAVNCANNGILCARLSPSDHLNLGHIISNSPNVLTVDLAAQIASTEKLSVHFETDSFQRSCLLEGRSSTDVAILAAGQVARFEANRGATFRWLSHSYNNS